MQITLRIDGADGAATASELRTWLHEARISEVKEIIQDERAARSGEMGIELLGLLNVVLSSPVLGSVVVAALIKSLFDFGATRESKTTIRVAAGKKEITLNLARIPKKEELAELVRTITESLK
jgi:hypothetical protein